MTAEADVVEVAGRSPFPGDMWLWVGAADLKQDVPRVAAAANTPSALALPKASADLPIVDGRKASAWRGLAVHAGIRLVDRCQAEPKVFLVHQVHRNGVVLAPHLWAALQHMMGGVHGQGGDDVVPAA